MPENWPGVRNSESVIGSDAPADACGVSFLVEGELRRRAGLTWLAAKGARLLMAYRSRAGTSYLIAWAPDGTVQAINLATGTAAQISSGEDTTNIPAAAVLNGRLYWQNGYNLMKVWNGVAATASVATITGPAAAPTAGTQAAGTTTLGVHLVRYRYLDNTSTQSTYRSNASLSVSETVATTTKKLTYTVGTNLVASTDAKATTIQLEATAAGGSDFYVVGTCENVAGATIVYDLADALLILNDLADSFDTNLPSTVDAGQGHDPAPVASVIAQVREYLFAGVDAPRSFTGVSATNGGTSVGITGADNFGSGFVIRFGTEATAYSITAAGSTTVTLANAYAGTTGTVTAVISRDDPNRVGWSAYVSGSGVKATLPESWKYSVRSRSVLQGTGDVLRGITEFYGDALFCGLYTMQRLVFVDDPGTGELDTVPGQFGVWNQRCFVRHEGELYGWGPNGVWRSSGGRPVWISRDIEQTYGALVDLTRSAQFHGHYDPVAKLIRWFFCRSGDTVPKDSFAIDLSGKRWMPAQWRQGIDASAFCALATGQLRAVLSDATNGFTWYNVGATDGVPAVSSGAYTGGIGSTTTVTQVQEALPTGGAGSDLNGVMLYRPGTGEAVLITSNTSASITHAAFATAVAPGEAVYAGAIPWSWTTSWWIGSGMDQAKRPKLWLSFAPTSVTTIIRVSFYIDQTETDTPTAFVFTSGLGDFFPPGVTVVNNQGYIEIDLAATQTSDGFLQLPVPMEWSRAIRAKVECLSPAGTLRILGLKWVLTSASESRVRTL